MDRKKNISWFIRAWKAITKALTWQRLTASLAIMAWLVLFGWVLATRLQHAQAPPQKHPEAASEGALATARIYLGRETSSPPHAILSWQGEDGSTLWQGDVEISASGSIELTDDLLPRLPAKADSWPGRLAVEAPSHLSAAVDLRFRRAEDGSGVTIEPRSFSLYLEPLQPWLTFLLLMPALAVLWLAICHLRLHNHGTPAWFYALVCGGSWLLVSLGMTWVFVEHEQHLIPLFLADAQVSSGLVIFTFLGTLVYLTFSVYSREPEFFTHETSEPDRDRLLRTLGGRLLAAPYVSVVAWLLLSMILPTLRSGPEVLFFGFFAGLWIKIVLDFLNRVGKNLLSQEALDRLKERHHRREAPELPPPPVRRAAYLPPPNPHYRAAIADARQELHGLEGVIGVGPGHRISQRDGQTGEPVITVYVAEKKELESGDPNLVPPSFGGVRTDVVTPDMVPIEEGCNHVASDLFWDKLGPALADDAADASNEAEWHDNVLILTHEDPNRLYRRFGEGDDFDWLFSPQHAYPLIAKEVGDAYDFIAFVVDDLAPGIFLHNDYFIPVHNDVAGIGYFWDPPTGGRFDARSSWRSEQPPSLLRGCQVHAASRLQPGSDDFNDRGGLWVLLHELGHAWCSYVDDHGPLLQDDKKHWAKHVDDGLSCMNYRRRRWVDHGNGRLELVDIGPEEFRFNPLELYLMGLLSRDELLGDPEEWPGIVSTDQKITKYRDHYEGARRRVDLASALRRWGARDPAAEIELPVTYRQLFVVVTASLDSGRQIAEGLESLRQRHARNVERATQGRLVLRTERVTN